ncbi:hypothetical protein [Sphingomonas daechungensis]|uniref:hypothetical protein n=1 Tax=Sphingomonas daechungensis TaxID=1176646 RepID=UPI0031EEE53E
MKRTTNRFYRWSRVQNNQGLLENSPDGRFRHNRAQAIGLLLIGIPLLVVIELNRGGKANTWLWLPVVAWSVGIVTIMLYQTFKTIFRYYRDWWKGRR